MYTPLTSIEVQRELHKLNLSLLQPYIKFSLPLIYLCTCGSVGSTRLAHLRSGVRCGKCVESKWRQLFIDNGCEIIEYNTAHSITYACSCGNTYTKRAKQWYDSSRKCKLCKTYHHKEYKVPTRKNLYLWKKKVLTRDEFKCIRCKDNSSLEAHHIDAYSIYPDLVSDITNGATLCYSCHKYLHRKYGLNVGRLNLQTEVEIEY